MSDILKCFHFHREDISVIIIIIIGCLSFNIYFQISVQIMIFFSVDSQDAKGRTLLMNVSVSGKVQGSGFNDERSRSVSDEQRGMEFITTCCTGW